MADVDFSNTWNLQGKLAGLLERAGLPEKEFADLYGEKQPLSVVYDVEGSYRDEAEKLTAQLAADSDKVYISYETLKAEFQQTKQVYSLIGGIMSIILGMIGIR